MEELIDKIKEFRILKSILKENNKKCFKRNAIIEGVNGEQFITDISINGVKEFDFIQPKKGINRKYISERSKSPVNPVNIERIAFIVNDEVIEFVRCL